MKKNYSTPDLIVLIMQADDVLRNSDPSFDVDENFGSLSDWIVDEP